MQKEIWKDVVGYEGLYQVSNTGMVKSLKRFIEKKNGGLFPVKEKILVNVKESFGYMVVSLYKNSVRKVHKVHRLVAKTHIDNPENKPAINHINGNKIDNRIENLEFCTNKENTMASIKIGLQNPVGADNWNAKLAEKEVLRILENKEKLTQRQLARKYNISNGHVSNILYGRKWEHLWINNGFPIPENNRKLREKQVYEILANKDGLSQRALARKYSVSYQNINCIVNRKTWRHLSI